MYQPEIEQFGEELYFVAGSPASRRLRMQAELLSRTDVPLLITGEAGSGKATTARLIHSLSIRSSFPFMRVNCAALTPDLLESELFGYEYVTVNGQTESKPGKFEICATGTILLQYLETIPSSIQLHLLRFLETKEFVRYGGKTQIRADVRIMAATRADLQQAVAEGRVHEDLYDRLSAFRLSIPSLRERLEEVPLLLGHFMNRLTRRYGVSAPCFSSSLLEGCQQYSWPGNLRQIEVFVKRLLVSGDEAAALEELNIHHGLEAEEGKSKGHVNGHSKNDKHPREENSSVKSLVRYAKDEAERNVIVHALEETHWNRKAAARLLNISYRSLLYKIQAYKLISQEGSPLSHRSVVGDRR